MKKIAIIGGGISGLGLLHLLDQNAEHEVTLFEQESVVGGHANGVSYDQDQIDTGFMVCNKKTYPNIMNLFGELQIPLHPTSMALSCSNADKQIEFSFENFGSSILQTIKNTHFLYHLTRSQYKIRKDIAHNRITEADTIESYSQRRKIHPLVYNYFTVPVVACVWSQMNEQSVGAMPAKQIFEFMNNHQLLQYNQPRWYSIEGSSRQYTNALSALHNKHIRTSCTVEKVSDHNGHKLVVVMQNGIKKQELFDTVVFACHSDEVNRMCSDLPQDMTDILESVQYKQNNTVLHTDTAWMPADKKNWGAWNFVKRSGDSRYVCTYWINKLQKIQSDKNIFITLDPTKEIDLDQVIDNFQYSHPIFTAQSHAALKKLDLVQGSDGYYLAGAWTRHGFHEDGLWSALKVFQHIEGHTPQGYQL